MTILILLVLIGLLWVAVLAPSVYRRFRERQGVGSIDHFHHQLRLLGQAAPKTVRPAYRLHTAVPDQSKPDVAAAVGSSRPNLVLLRPTNDAQAADVDDHDGRHYKRVAVLDRPEPVSVPDAGAELPAYRRELARRRWTVLLCGTVAVTVFTGLVGFWPELHLVWVFTVLSGLAALGLVGLMAYAKEVEAERRLQRVRAANRAVSRERDVRVGRGFGSPAAWDEGFLEVQVAAR